MIIKHHDLKCENNKVAKPNGKWVKQWQIIQRRGCLR